MMRGTKLALASALVLGLSTAPAQAADQFAYCDPLAPAGAALYSGGPPQAPRSAAEAPSASPSAPQTHADMPASAKGRAGKGFKATVPVYFHVVTDGADRRAHRRADRRADRGAQQHLRRRRGRREHGLPLHARGHDADGQRGLVLRGTRAAPTSTR